MAIEWTRVKDRRTGHHLTVAVVNPDHHTVLKQDAVDRRGKPLPPKPRESAPVAKQAAAKKATAKKSTPAPAEPKKEQP